MNEWYFDKHGGGWRKRWPNNGKKKSKGGGKGGMGAGKGSGGGGPPIHIHLPGGGRAPSCTYATPI